MLQTWEDSSQSQRNDRMYSPDSISEGTLTISLMYPCSRVSGGIKGFFVHCDPIGYVPLLVLCAFSFVNSPSSFSLTQTLEIKKKMF